MTDRHKKIRELNLEEQIRVDFFKNNKPMSTIAQELSLPFSAVQRFIREEKMRNYSDTRLQEVARSGEYNALGMVDDLFDASSQASKEMAYTAILAQIFREEISEIIAEKGINGLFEDDNKDVVNLWFRNSEKLSKLHANSPKFLESYLNLLNQVLDVQRQVSFVKVVTEELRKADPVLHKKIFDALNKDPVAKSVLGSISNEEIVEYWASERRGPGRANISAKKEEEDEN